AVAQAQPPKAPEDVKKLEEELSKLQKQVKDLEAKLKGAKAEPVPQTREEKLWADLASGDEATALRAALLLAKTPKETVTFLKDNLLPVKADPKRVAKLI